MRLVLFLPVFLLLASVSGATNELRVTTTSTTNLQTHSVNRVETFTRGGATNLVRRTKTKDGAPQVRIHRFYHGGTLVGDHIAMPNTSGFTTEAGTPYSVSLEFATNNAIKSVLIAKQGVLLDVFSFSEGLFEPVPNTTIQKVNAVGSDLGELFLPNRIQRTTPQQFNKDVQDLIQKHKTK